MAIKTSIIVADGNLYAKVDRKGENIQYFVKAETWRMWHPRNRVLVAEVALNGREASKQLIGDEARNIMRDIESGVIDAKALRAPYRVV